MQGCMDLRSDRSERVDYNQKDFPAYIRMRKLSAYPNYAAVSHWHDDIECIVVQKGHMKYNINGVIVALEEGMGILVNSRQLHYGFSEDHTECEFLCILLHPRLLCTSEYVERSYVTPIVSAEDFSFLYLDSELSWKQSVIADLWEIYESVGKEEEPLLVQSLFFRLWCSLYRNIPFREMRTQRGPSQLFALKEMIGYIQKNYRNKITLTDIALAGQVCKSSCCMIFQKYLQQTPIAYLIEYRLQKSIDLMNSTSLSITEIGMETGFSGPSYFSETFHKHFGCSPKEYRRKK